MDGDTITGCLMLSADSSLSKNSERLSESENSCATGLLPYPVHTSDSPRSIFNHGSVLKLPCHDLICTQLETREALSPGRSTANPWMPAEYSIFSVPASSKLNR